MSKTVSNLIKRILGIVKKEIQAEKETNKKAPVEVNHHNTPIIKQIKQRQTIIMTLTQNFLYLI